MKLRPTLFALAVAACSGILGPSSAHAQTFRGRIVDSVTEAPLSATTVDLTRVGGGVVKSLQTGRDGLFSVNAAPGRYVLTFRRIAYDSLSSPLFPVSAGQTVDLLVGMHPLSAKLDSVVSRAEPEGSFFTRVTTGHAYLARHYSLGKGMFASGWQIEHANMLLSEFLSTMEGLELVRPYPAMGPAVPAAHGKVLTTRGAPRCLSLRVDRTSLPRLMMMWQGTDIDALIPLKDVMAVEVYPTAADIPQEWEADASAGRAALMQPAAVTIADIGSTPLFRDTGADVRGSATVQIQDQNLTRAPGPTNCAFIQLWTSLAY